MKKIIPFSISALCTALVACGGGSNTIHEDPVKKPAETTAVGCTVAATSNACFEFVMEYPIAGLQYTCTSDKVNTFITQPDGNTVTGGCNTGDTVDFFLNATDNYRIDLGSVKLSDLGFVSAKNIPVHLTILDMAKGLTGKSASSLSINDETTYVALQLVKIFQAIGEQKTNSNIIGDIQPIILKNNGLSEIDKITGKVDVTALKNGSYANTLKPWIDVTKITDAEALDVLKQVSHVTLGAVYQADPPIILAATEGLLGYAGVGANRKTLLGAFFLMSDRQGYTQGYGMQWRGVPSKTGESAAVALSLITETNPLMMRASAQANWIDIVSKRIGTVEKFKFVSTNNEEMFINQGRLLNDYGVAGSDVFYKFLTNQQQNVVANDLAKWTQNTGSDQYAGNVDLVKAYPISYLDRQVFKAERNVASGEKYHFPLYATLTFRQSDTSLSDTKLGIVIDEFGDIRTDIGANATATDLSGQCGIVADPKAATFTDSNNVQQYRIGTLSATNYQPQQQDLSIVPRIILAGAQYGLLDGVFIGVNDSVLGTDGSLPVNDNGVKINLYNLINNNNNAATLNITNYKNGVARWVNVYHTYKSIFINNTNNAHDPTDEEKNQMKAISGNLSIQLAPCYTVKTKA